MDGQTLTKIYMRGGHPVSLKDKSLHYFDYAITFMRNTANPEWFHSGDNTMSLDTVPDAAGHNNKCDTGQ